MVSVAKDKLIVWSVTGIEGTLAAPKATIQRTGQVGAACDGAYMCETSTCEAGICKASSEAIAPVYDYRALNAALYEIAKRHYTGKLRAAPTYQAILMADGSIPYGTIISLMGAMRCKMPAIGKEAGPCYLPNADDVAQEGPEGHGRQELGLRHDQGPVRSREDVALPRHHLLDGVRMRIV